MPRTHPTWLRRTGAAGALLAALWLGSPISEAHAQDGEFDVEALRAALERDEQLVRSTQAGTEDRLAALQRVRYPDDEFAAALLGLGADRSEPPELRLAVLQRALFGPEYLDVVFGIIEDLEEPESLATGLVEDLGRRVTFRQPTDVRQRLQRVLRGRLEDSRPTLRLASFRILVASHDARAVDLLVSGLREGSPPIPPAEAIALLDLDGTTKHLETVAPFLGDERDDVRAEAARVLASDPDRRSEVVGLVRDPTTAVSIRVRALRALAREDADFFDYALRLMQNRTEAADVRYAAMEGAMVRINYHGEQGPAQVRFAQAVEAIAGGPAATTSGGLDLKAEAKALLAHLQQNLPAVRRHYATP